MLPLVSLRCGGVASAASAASAASSAVSVSAGSARRGLSWVGRAGLRRGTRMQSAASGAAPAGQWDAGRRMMRARYHVSDVAKTVEYMEGVYGMRVVEGDGGRGGGGETTVGFDKDAFCITLLARDGEAGPLDLGAGFGHMGLQVDDVYSAVDKVKAAGGLVSREAGPVKGGSTHIAFVKDPDGYSFELLQRPPTPERINQVMLRTGDLEASTGFYARCLGMTELRRRVNEQYAYTLQFVGYGEDDLLIPVMELTYNHGKDGKDAYDKGNAYDGVELATSDLERTRAELEDLGVEVERLGQGRIACKDPDGYTVYFRG